VKNIVEAVQGGLNIEKVQLLSRNEIKNYPALCKKLKYSGKKQIPILSQKDSKSAQEEGEEILYLKEMKSL
jgi:hypothetical protein